MASKKSGRASNQGTTLAGKSAVITGASRGIGLECAHALHEAGAEVVLVARGKEALQKVARNMGERATAVAGDLGDFAAVQRALREIRKVLGGVPDVLVNNAGRFSLAPVEQTTVDEFARTLQLNLTGPFAFVRDFLPDLRKRGRGHIVTIGSIADHRAFSENAAYAASKFGVRGLHEVLREELRGSGVRTTLISPSPVDTALWDSVNPDGRAGFTPRKRMLSPQAVADAVLFAVTRPAEVNVDELRVSRA